MSGKGKKLDRGAVIIKREEVVEGGHHGGAWKVAYADFVTAMMAFFLLMWLLNATSEEQKRGIADYFSPFNPMSHGNSGSGKPFGGLTPFSKGQMVSDKGVQSLRPGAAAPPEGDDPDAEVSEPPKPPGQAPSAGAGDAGGDNDGSAADGGAGQATAHGNADTAQTTQGAQAPGGGQAAAQAKSPVDNAQFLANMAAAQKADPRALDDAALRRETERREKQAFAQAAEQIRAAVQDDPAMAELARQLTIDQTPEGMRIQLLDEDKLPMFATGSAAINERARLLLQKIAPVLMKMPEQISISGHTDATPFRGDGRSNWELSAERASATRRLLAEAGLQEARFRSVTGNADRDPLLPADPFAAANRRIAIVVLRLVNRAP